MWPKAFPNLTREQARIQSPGEWIMLTVSSLKMGYEPGCVDKLSQEYWNSVSLTGEVARYIEKWITC